MSDACPLTALIPGPAAAATTATADRVNQSQCRPRLRMQLVGMAMGLLCLTTLQACGGGGGSAAGAAGSAAPMSAAAAASASAVSAPLFSPLASADVALSPLSAGSAAPLVAADAASLHDMRAVHMEGNRGGNVLGVRWLTPDAFTAGASLSADAVTVTSSVSRFVDAQGVTQTNHVARVRMRGVTVGGSTRFDQAGFLVTRDVATGTVFLQFRPGFDESLDGVPGFSGDVNLILSPDGKQVNAIASTLANGPAQAYLGAVVAHAPELLQAASTAFTVTAPSTLDRATTVAALRNIRSYVQAIPTAYFDFLRQQKAGWVGISVAMFLDSVSDPTVRLRYAPVGADTATTYTFTDDDLTRLIALARQNGLQVYLTLAIEPSSNNLPPSLSDPTCNTASYLPNRGLLGMPTIHANDANQGCITTAQWWWAPSHPLHAQNVARFWQSYSALAVKYAALAQRTGVSMFSLGTETDWLFRTRATARVTTQFSTQLAAMVAAVRGVYGGILTYDQQSNITTNPAWFDGGEWAATLYEDLKLDAVGISAYFPLTATAPNRVLSVAELQAAWDTVFSKYLVPMQAANPGRPILFTEFGYTDHIASPNDPQIGLGSTITEARDGEGATPGMRQQQNILQAFFDVNARRSGLVRGAFLWGNPMFTGDGPWQCDHVYFNQYCKPSAQTVATVYGRTAPIAADYDRVFDFAESRWPGLFSPPAATTSGAGYLYRYYPAQGLYVGTRDGRLVLHDGGRNWSLADIGSLDDFFSIARSQGF